VSAVDAILGELPSDAATARAVTLLEGCPYSTTALMAMHDALCELGQVREAKLLAGLLESFAALEAEGL
jgi:hypothetical protein